MALVAVLALVGAAGGAAYLVLGSNPEEFSRRGFAREMCTTAIEPAHERIDDALGADGADLDVVDEQDADDAIAAATELVAALETAATEVLAFNARARLRGEEGEDLHSELAEAFEEWRSELGELRAEVAGLDRSEPDDLGEDLTDLLDGFSGLDLALEESDPAGFLPAALDSVSEDCGEAIRSWATPGVPTGVASTRTVVVPGESREFVTFDLGSAPFDIEVLVSWPDPVDVDPTLLIGGDVVDFDTRTEYDGGEVLLSGRGVGTVEVQLRNYDFDSATVTVEVRRR